MEEGYKNIHTGQECTIVKTEVVSVPPMEIYTSSDGSIWASKSFYQHWGWIVGPAGEGYEASMPMGEEAKHV